MAWHKCLTNSGNGGTAPTYIGQTTGVTAVETIDASSYAGYASLTADNFILNPISFPLTVPTHTNISSIKAAAMYHRFINNSMSISKTYDNTTGILTITTSIAISAQITNDSFGGLSTLSMTGKGIYDVYVV